jgi:hypothetical protein
MGDHRQYALTVAVFAAVLYLALVVAAFGMLSLITDLDVIGDPSAGPLVGPIMTGVAVIVVFVMMLAGGVRMPPGQQRIQVGYAVATGVAATAAFIATGALLRTIETRTLFELVNFPAALLGGPFAWSVGILAFIVALLYSWLIAARFTERGRPLWPWERRGE